MLGFLVFGLCVCLLPCRVFLEALDPKAQLVALEIRERRWEPDLLVVHRQGLSWVFLSFVSPSG